MVEGSFGPELLNYPCEAVGDEDETEQRVLQRTDNEDDGEQPPEQRVERGEDVGAEDLGDRVGARGRNVVDQSEPSPFGYLGLGQPARFRRWVVCTCSYAGGDAVRPGQVRLDPLACQVDQPVENSATVDPQRVVFVFVRDPGPQVGDEDRGFL